MYEEKLHFSISFSFETQFEERQNDPGQGFEGDIFAQTRGNPAMTHSRSDTVFLPGIVIYPVDRDMQCWNNQALDKSYPYKIPENKVTEKESALGLHLSAWVKLC